MKFSVIIPVHNAEKTITRCVDSLITNTFCDFEIVAVEDGSSDKSWEVLCELAEKYPRLKIFKNDKNRGVSYTRNRGLDQAKGDYICFTDSDDWVEPTYLQAFSDALEKAEDALPICGFVNHDEKYNGRCDEYRWDGFEGNKVFLLSEKLEDLQQHSLLQQLWNKSFRTDIIRDGNGRFDESISIGEDFRFILSYLENARFSTIQLINKALYHYMRDQAGSLMYQVGRESVEEPLKNQQRMFGLMGLSDEVITTRLNSERARICGVYAYLIMHNVGMSFWKKRKLILALDPNIGKELFKKNVIVFYKEKIAKAMGK